MNNDRRNTLMARLADLAPGDALWVETNLADYHKLQARATNTARYPRALRSRRFTAALYTCVGSRAGDIRYCVRIERLPDFNPPEST